MAKTLTPEKAEKVAADQEAMEEARRAVAEAENGASGTAPEPAVPVTEEKGGQLAISGPGTEPMFSTDGGGTPPEEGELRIAARAETWGADLQRGTDMLLLTHVHVSDVLISSKKRFLANIVNFVEFEPADGMGPREALMAVHDLKSRARYDRSVIDQAAELAQEILENEAPESGVDLAATMRERLYDRYHVEDDAKAVTFGTEDHMDEEPAPEDDPDWTEPGAVDDALAVGIGIAEEPTDAEVLKAREADLEARIEAAIDDNDREREQALRDELEEVRIAMDPDLGWEQN